MLTDDEYARAMMTGHTAGLLAQAAEWLGKLGPAADSPADAATARSVAWQCAREVGRILAAEPEPEPEPPGPIWWEIDCRECGQTWEHRDVARPGTCPVCDSHRISVE